MNRSGRDYHLVGGRNFPAGSLNLRRGHSLTGGAAPSRDADEDLDLFSRNRRSISVVASDESSDAAALKLGRLSVSVGTAKLARNAADDLLSSDSGKNDYDWLLTPPGTPLFPSEGSEPQPKVAAPRTSSLSRSTSTTKASRLSVSQSEVSHHTARPTRSSSVTRSSSLSTSHQFNAYSSNNRSSSSILNTSSASVSSYTRPSSPITRSSSTARPSTPSTRSSSSRPSTPSRVRPSPSTSSTEKPRPTLSSRPSTPSSRPQTPSSRPQMSSTSTLPSARSTSRPSTPTRRNSAPSLSSSISSISTSRVSSNSRPSSRPSSPGPKIRPSQQPIVLPDFSLDTPPNLRTTLPDRPLSAGRSRPPPSAKGNPEAATPSSLPRRQSSPVVTRGRLSVSESNGRGGRSHSNAAADFHEPRRASHAPDLGMKKPVKNVANAAPETNGFGRNISKKSLDMAIRHMDIRNGNGSLRALSNTTLFPQSIRSSTSRTQSNRAASVHPNGSSDAVSENGSWVENGSINGNYSAKLSDLDLYESSRYDAILLKEDMKNMNWLHSVDDKSEVGSIFDGGFETLPEPFGPL